MFLASLLFLDKNVKQIIGVSKQTLKIVPLSGQTTATNGQKVIVSLPPNSLVDLSTLEMNFVGATQHRGNAAASNVANYVQKAYFPRNTACNLFLVVSMAFNNPRADDKDSTEGFVCDKRSGPG